MNIQSGIVPRNQLYQRLDQAIKSYKILYVGCHIGWGKTTAILDWISNRDKPYLYLSASEEDFYEKFCKLDVPKSTIIILDDLYMISSNNIEDALIQIIAQKPNRFIMISRTAILPMLKPYIITHQLISFTAADLAFSKEEIALLIDHKGFEASSPYVEYILKESKGWILGISMVVNHLKHGEELNAEIIERARFDVYDIFDVMLFNRWDIEVRRFLMAMANFSEFTEEMAHMVTGKKNLAMFIRELQRMGSFIIFIPPDTYKIQKSFREFLIRKKEDTYSKDIIARHYQNAALYYELHDNIAKALAYYHLSGDNEKLAELLEENSRCHPGTGHYYDTEKYYLSLPEGIINDSPDLMSGISMLHSLCCRPKESEYWFEQLVAFSNTVDQHDSLYKLSKARIAYLSITLPHRATKNMADI